MHLPAEVTRVAREVGTEGKLGGQAEVREWRERGKISRITLTSWPAILPARSATSPKSQPPLRMAISRKKITVDVRGEILQLKETHQHDGRAVAFVRRRSDARGSRSRHRRPAGWTGQRSWRCRHVERSDRFCQCHGRQPDRSGAQHRRGHDGCGSWRSCRAKSRST